MYINTTVRKNHINKQIEYAMLKKNILQPYGGSMMTIAEAICHAFSTGKRMYICGNGGSSADAEHIAAEFIKNYRIKRMPLKTDRTKPAGNEAFAHLHEGMPAFALSSMATISAISNDMGYEWSFAQQLYVYTRPGDIVVLLSTSGQSPNILNAAAVAKESGTHVIGITGKKEVPFTKLCNQYICVREKDTTAIQETYMCIMHTVCAVVEKVLYSDD